MAKRLIEFLRSVLPADPYQLLFLAGVVCLSTIHGVKWWPASARTSRDHVANSFGQFLVNAGNIFLLPILFAAAAGWFVCFWPGKHPVRRISKVIIVPVVASIFLTLALFSYLAGPASSILQGAGVTTANELKWIQSIVFESFGLQITLMGLSLTLLFVLRLVFGVSSLPLSLSSARADESDALGEWRRVLMLIWFLVALESFLGGGFILLAAFSFPASIGKRWFVGAVVNALSLASLAIALLITGKDGRKTIRESIVAPKYKWTAFALSFPIAIEALIFVTRCRLDGIHLSFPTEVLPADQAYFARFARSFLVLLLPAFFEEVVFRGFLQNRFIRRYGMYRGIFLVCITWAAFHLHSDLSFRNDSYLQIFYRLSGRIIMTLGIGFVLSWVTLKSRTVLPSSICHAFYNAIVFSPPGFLFMSASNMRTTLWGLAAIILFRFWPPVSTGPRLEAQPPPEDAPQTGSSDSAPAPSGDDGLPTTA